jgi:hypothetical protein
MIKRLILKYPKYVIHNPQYTRHPKVEILHRDQNKEYLKRITEKPSKWDTSIWKDWKH